MQRVLDQQQMIACLHTEGRRTLIVGDVHGCPDELDALLRVAGYDRSSDLLVMVGDLVAKGPDSKAVIDRVRELSALCVRGNHEEHVLRGAWAAHSDAGTKPLHVAHRAVLEVLSEDDLAYLGGLPYQLWLPEHCVRVVHAGFEPTRALEAQTPGVMTNVRNIDDHGRPSRSANEGRAWASLWHGPEHVVFGHDAARMLQLYPYATGLDTGCVYGGELTALELPSRRRYCVPARRAYEAVRS